MIICNATLQSNGYRKANSVVIIGERRAEEATQNHSLGQIRGGGEVDADAAKVSRTPGGRKAGGGRAREVSRGCCWATSFVCQVRKPSRGKGRRGECGKENRKGEKQ